MTGLRLEDFDYRLPPELIAQSPAEPRDSSRLLVLRRAAERMEHALFADLASYLGPADCLVLNDSRVIPARLTARRMPGGGALDVLLVNRVGPGRWEALVRPGRKALPGMVVVFDGAGENLEARVVERTPAGGRVLQFATDDVVLPWLERYGRLPLPPYIRQYPDDPGRYQTVYAREDGAVAAPTAGLHFTPELLHRIRSAGVIVAAITLHVGPATFLPVRAADPVEHRPPPEAYAVPAAVAREVNAARERGGRVVAVGTTVVRALETAGASGLVQAGRGWTDLFLYPGYRFRVVDALITNFHLPRTSLMMLVAAFLGDAGRLREAYEQAVTARYRFYSFGDAMLIL
ncbi:MAG: tRNA preQ1(34) S-adenosylmethionine ribosyltransferase-isomerase QueA [bacterium]|nr:tRNA preQ1(34) S-adenosylmethionine ribosyltransferase-isomerase QueA [bacterium]